MAHPAISRFVVPARALIGLAVTATGAAFGYYYVYLDRYVARHSISVIGIVLAGGILLAGLGFTWAAFPAGCRGCRNKFLETGSTFGLEQYEAVLRAIQLGDVAAVRELASAPVAGPGGGVYTSLAFRYCPACKRVGQASLIQARWNGQFSESTRIFEQDVVGEAARAWVEMLEARPRPAGDQAQPVAG